MTKYSCHDLTSLNIINCDFFNLRTVYNIQKYKCFVNNKIIPNKNEYLRAHRKNFTGDLKDTAYTSMMYSFHFELPQVHNKPNLYYKAS